MRDDNFSQMNLFNFNREYKIINKPVRLIEFFSGIGAQAKALEILGVPFEHYKTCEWAALSIKAYNYIHMKDFTDYSAGLTKEDIVRYLDGNISTNYDEPCDVSKKSESWLRDIYNNCIATHNLMNIMKVKGSDLGVVDTDSYEYILTYSFPCQDLSNAGNKKGMAVSQADGGTRSGLLWEVERILGELEHKPQILLMENVPDLVGVRNIKYFQKWEAKLTELGYTNYVGILNAKNYGIPQNRRRCFMVSILGDYSYDLPKSFTLKYLLKDFLEENVDEKYYLSDAMIKFITAKNDKWTGNNSAATVNRDIGCTINTAPGQRRCDASDYIVDGLPSNSDLRLVIKNATKQGYLTAEEGDGVDISTRMESHRGTVQKCTCQTITTMGGENVGVVVKEAKNE